MEFEKKYEESALLTLLSCDSEYAFQFLFDRYRNKIYTVALMYVKSAVIAEEIVQDVFLKLWYQRKNITEICSLENWLFTLTRNQTFNCLKKIAHESMAREKWIEQNVLSENTTDQKILNEEYQQLHEQAINNLTQHQHQVYTLGKEDGLPYDAISKSRTISPLPVKHTIERACASLSIFF